MIGGYTLPEGSWKYFQWVKPVLVAQVKFTEWTHDDQPVFLGLRTDKEAKDVVRG